MTEQKYRKNGTKTSSFGTPDGSIMILLNFIIAVSYTEFQISKNILYKENQIPQDKLNIIYCKSSECMSELPDSSIHLMITSPPYNVKKEYDEDLSLDEYRKLLQNVFKETYRVLVTGGRACINIANLGRKPYIPLHSFIIEDMLEIGFMMG